MHLYDIAVYTGSAGFVYVIYVMPIMAAIPICLYMQTEVINKIIIFNIILLGLKVVEASL